MSRIRLFRLHNSLTRVWTYKDNWWFPSLFFLFLFLYSTSKQRTRYSNYEERDLGTAERRTFFLCYSRHLKTISSSSLPFKSHEHKMMTNERFFHCKECNLINYYKKMHFCFFFSVVFYLFRNYDHQKFLFFAPLETTKKRRKNNNIRHIMVIKKNRPISFS